METCLPPAARITDMHTCPMVTGIVPHVGGPILPPGAPTVLINFLPAATVTSMLVCVGPPDVIVKGSAGVLINFLPAARMGDQTAHGGVIVLGSPNVIIGEIGSPSPGGGGMGGIVAGLALAGVAAAQVPNASVLAVSRERVAVPPIEPPAVKPGAVAPSVSEKDSDGVLVGKGCQPLTTKKEPGESISPDEIKSAWGSAYVSNSPCCQAMRASGASPQKIVYVNGIKTDRAAQCVTLQKIADQTCAPVLGVHNSTNGMLSDLLQSRKDKSLIDQAQMGKPFAMQDGRNPAVDSMSDMITNSVRSNDPTTFYAHSQGGDILSLASYQSNLDLVNAGYDEGVSGVKAVTMASAAQSYPSALSAQHFVNIQDFVPTWLGVGKDPAKDLANTGPGQEVLRFTGAPGATDPTFLSDQQMSEMLANHDAPWVSPTKYHDVDTTYLNAVKKEDGGC